MRSLKIKDISPISQQARSQKHTISTSQKLTIDHSQLCRSPKSQHLHDSVEIFISRDIQAGATIPSLHHHSRGHSLVLILALI